MKYLGIDYGLKRVGIAVSDDNGKIAFPKDVISSDENLVNKVKDFCLAEKVTGIVLGDSKNFKGEDNEVMSHINKFSENLKKVLNLPIYFEPEFMTSIEATRIQGDIEKIDASAAAIILQSFLNKMQNGKIKIEEPRKDEVKNKISYDEFSKTEMKVGKILSVEKVPNTDKLLRLEVDFGEEKPRQIISGIALYFPDIQVLVGKKCLFVTNLEPRVIKGLESNGMILALSTPDGAFSLLEPNENIPIGTKVK